MQTLPLSKSEMKLAKRVLWSSSCERTLGSEFTFHFFSAFFLRSQNLALADDGAFMKRNYFLKGKISFRLTRMRRKARNRLVHERLGMHIRTANTMTMTTTWHQWIPACSRESFQESKLFVLPSCFFLCRPQSSSSMLQHLAFLLPYLCFMRPPHPHSHATTTLDGKNTLCRVATGDEQKIAVNKSEKGHERQRCDSSIFFAHYVLAQYTSYSLRLFLVSSSHRFAYTFFCSSR